jgi:alkylation response protein AidB-like acyl-CoA dehydrogenase
MTELAELHDDLRAVARDLLARPDVPWSQVADAGWTGLEVPEELDGAGATFAEVAVVLHELGRAASSASLLGTVLGVGALLEVAPSAERDDLLRRVATGQARVTVADADAPTFVPDAPDADVVLVLHADGITASESPVVEETPVLDATRRFGTVATTDGDRWPFADPSARRRVLDRGALAVACDSLGSAEAMLDATVAYAGVREQFGRPIGSFQAVKHACADMLVQVTVCRELVTAAVATLDPVDVARAKSYVTAAAVDVVGKAMQLHGGIGYTWESDVHVHLKRVALNRSLYGAPAEHRRRLAERFTSRAAPTSAAAPG